MMLRLDLEKETYSKYYHDLVDYCKNKYPEEIRPSTRTILKSIIFFPDVWEEEMKRATWY